jgi:hypothetical protein
MTSPRVFVLLLIAQLVAGCALAREKLPTHPMMSAEQTRLALAERAHATRSVSAEGTITLTRPNGESIRFDGALVMRPPDRARLRAWKFGQAVFDLTLTPDGAWLLVPSDSSRAAEIRSAGASAADLAGTWADLSGRFFDSPLEAMMPKERADRYLFKRTNPDGSRLYCRVDRKTLTVRNYSLMAGAKERFSLSLSHYSLIGDVPFAHRLIATSETGAVQVDLRDVELNGEIPAGAFAPPRRAEKLK